MIPTMYTSVPGDEGPAPAARARRRVCAAAFCVIALVLVSPDYASAEKVIPRPDALLIRLLTVGESAWPYALAEEFVRAIPMRIADPLSGQTAKTIPYFVTQKRLPRRSTRSPIEFVCWASVGSGGGYLAIIRRERGRFKPVWDSLIPPGFIVPKIEFTDVVGDSLPEIVCSGERLEGGVSEWAVVRWDGTAGHLLAPRLDQPGRSFWYNRLIGHSLRIEVEPGDSAKVLMLTVGDIAQDDSLDTADSTEAVRAFHYNSAIDGFLPPP